MKTKIHTRKIKWKLERMSCYPLKHRIWQSFSDFLNYQIYSFFLAFFGFYSSVSVIRDKMEICNLIGTAAEISTQHDGHVGNNNR